MSMINEMSGTSCSIMPIKSIETIKNYEEQPNQKFEVSNHLNTYTSKN